MVFTLEQNKFIIMSYYRNGIKRDGEWTYSVQACKEEFIAIWQSRLHLLGSSNHKIGT
jgi:hypothetical protein